MKNTEDNMASEKDQYVEKRKAQLDEWNAEIEELGVKIASADADAKAKIKHEEHIADLRRKRDDAKVKLAEIKAAGDDQWENLKDGLENVWTSMKDGFEKIKAKF